MSIASASVTSIHRPVAGIVKHVPTPKPALRVDPPIRREAKPEPLLDLVLALCDKGYSLVPQFIDKDGQKLPAGNALLATGHRNPDDRTKCEIRSLKNKPATRDQIETWWSHGVRTFAVYCGLHGAPAEVDFENEAFYHQWLREVGSLADGLPVVRTRSGGYHVVLKTDLPIKTEPLAYEPNDAAPDGRELAVEVRGEGFLVTLPHSHSGDGRRYELVSGDYLNPPHIPRAQARALIEAARSLCQAPKTRREIEAERAYAATRQEQRAERLASSDGVDVFKRFNEAHAITEALQRYGYAEVSGCANRMHRPGGTKPTVEIGSDNRSRHHGLNDPIYAYAKGKPVDPFDAFCFFEHGGNVSKAKRAAEELMGIKRPAHKPAPTSAPAPVATPINTQATNPAPLVQSGITSPLPTIITTGRKLRELTDEAMAALDAANDLPVLFVRDALARVVPDKDGAMVAGAVGIDEIRGRLARVADFQRYAKKQSVDDEPKLVDIDPPTNLCRDILSLGLWPFPALDGIISRPCLRPDGTVLGKPGYDADTRLYYAPSFGVEVPQIPHAPTREDADAAVAAIWDVIGEFPFDSEASVANAFAMLLTPALRPAIRGNAPLFMLDKPTMGTGGSLLSEVAGWVATGKAPATMGAPDSDEEWGKRITAKMASGATFCIVDNCEGVLESSEFARALTSPVWSDRILGRSQEVSIPNRMVWIINGNNVMLGRNMARRTVRVRMDPNAPRPWKADKRYRHPNLIEFVSANVGRLQAAALTICRAWFVAGKPTPRGLRAMGSFEDWHRTLAGVLDFVEIDGLLANAEEMFHDADEESNNWGAFIAAWHAAYGDKPQTVNALTLDLTPRNSPHADIDPRRQLCDAMPSEFIGHLPKDDRERQTFKIIVGKALKKRNGMVFEGDLKLVKGENDSHNKVSTWIVTKSVRGVRGVLQPQRTREKKDRNTRIKGRGAETLPAPPATPAPIHPDQFDPHWRAEYDKRLSELDQQRPSHPENQHEAFADIIDMMFPDSPQTPA